MAISRPILLVEDDEMARQALVEHLELSGFRPVEAGTIAQAKELMETPDARFDAILLDLSLPDGDGRDFCAQMRRDGYATPVIMLTGSSGDDDIVRGLDVGANDYICKPFRASELIARILAQLRAFDNSVDGVFVIGPYTFRPGAKLLTHTASGKKVALTGKEVGILRFLYRNGPRPVPRQVLLNQVWGYNPGVTSHTLETHIYRLRQKIETDVRNPCLLVTVGSGYQLNALEGPEAAAFWQRSMSEATFAQA
jgi:DNA-binding response OmpR family regulator